MKKILSILFFILSCQSKNNSNFSNVSLNEKQKESIRYKGIPKIFVGSIIVDNFTDLKIWMKLYQDGSKLEGEYYYLKNSKGERLKLNGTIDDKGNIILVETDKDENRTGEFIGSYEEGIFYGTWKSPYGKKEFRFVAFEQFVSPNIEFETRQIEEVNKEKFYNISVIYPEIMNIRGANLINQRIREFVEKEISDFKNEIFAPDKNIFLNHPSEYNIRYKITYSDEKIISLCLIIYTYLSGAAHGLISYETINFDINRGSDINLSDIFIENSNYLERISEIVKEKIRKKVENEMKFTNLIEEWLDEGTAPKEENYSAWSISKDGIIFYFAPYQVGPYALGSFQILVPYNEIKDLLKPNSPISYLIN